jgi:hypothetical protein
VDVVQIRLIDAHSVSRVAGFGCVTEFLRQLTRAIAQYVGRLIERDFAKQHHVAREKTDDAKQHDD